MYNLYNEVQFLNGSKINYKVTCPNSNTTRRGGATHKKNYWNKLEDGVYTCSECGCRMKAMVTFKEEKVILKEEKVNENNDK